MEGDQDGSNFRSPWGSHPAAAATFRGRLAGRDWTRALNWIIWKWKVRWKFLLLIKTDGDEDGKTVPGEWRVRPSRQWWRDACCLKVELLFV